LTNPIFGPERTLGFRANNGIFVVRSDDGGASWNAPVAVASHLFDGENEVVDLGKHDRVVQLGTAIPSAPVIAILEGGARLFVGVEGGIGSLPAIETQDIHRYFWHQPF
jgi:hypothetical protein